MIPTLSATSAEVGGYPSTSSIGGVDIAVAAIYLVGVVAIGLFAAIRKPGENEQARDYFLAGGTLRWPVIGLALFATNISCVHLVSLAQSGFDTGLLNGNFEWMAAFTLILLGLFFAPLYLRARVATLPDFLERRYSRLCRDWLAVLSVVSAVIIHIGFSFLTGGIVIQSLFGFSDIYLGIIVIAVMTGIYTVVGGLMAVVVTEAIQTFVLVGGSILITLFAWHAMGSGSESGWLVGGWREMTRVLHTPDQLGESHAEKLSMLRPHGDPSGLPWYAVFLGYPVLGIWYWCADQTIVQRVLGARDENHARVAPLFAGLIKILPVFIFVLPGLFAFTLYQSGKLDGRFVEVAGVRDLSVADAAAKDAATTTPAVAALNEHRRAHPDAWQRLEAAGVVTGDTINLQPHDPAQRAVVDEVVDEPTRQLILAGTAPVTDSKNVYTALITGLLPQGLIGVMIASLLAALMSTVAGALNSISTLVSYDLYQRFVPAATDRRLVLVGRVSATLALLVAIGLVPLLRNYESIFNALNTIIAHIAPPVTCVFLLGVFWRGASARSAEVTLVLGSALGVAVFFLNTLLPSNPLNQLAGGFMMMAVYLFLACVVLQVGVSLVTPSALSESAALLVWDRPWTPLLWKGWSGMGDYRVLATALFLVMVVLYATFR